MARAIGAIAASFDAFDRDRAVALRLVGPRHTLFEESTACTWLNETQVRAPHTLHANAIGAVDSATSW
jgi:hypothetical protein